MTERTPWEGGYAAVNSFSLIGGSNAHVLLKSTDIVNPSHVAATAARLVTCSGRTKEAVEAMLDEVLQRPTDVEMQYLLQNSVADTTPVLNPYRGATVVNAATNQQTIEVVLSGIIIKMMHNCTAVVIYDFPKLKCQQNSSQARVLTF